jgi:cell division protein ZapD
MLFGNLTLTTVAYELPLHEHIRVLIRLESLLEMFIKHYQSPEATSIFLALKSLDDILSVLERNNIKKYMGSEIGDIKTSLGSWRKSPKVDVAVIDSMIDDLNRYGNRVAVTVDAISNIADLDFIKNFRQRVNVPGGTSLVDFPRFHYWLKHDVEATLGILALHAQSISYCHKMVSHVLKIIRQGAEVSKRTAEGGFFQESVDKNVEYKLMRVVLPEDAPCFAEISGGRYHVTIRMVTDDWESGISSYKQDVDFVLEKCSI